MTERFALDALPWKAWKNGAGRTREIAAEPPGADFDAFGWRVSVAEVAGDAPFSAFPGIDRCIVLLGGKGMWLRSDDGLLDHRLERLLEPFHFDGARPLRATPVDGPCTDFNVMTRRGQWRSEVRGLEAPARLPGADAMLVLAVAGAPTVDGERLARGEGWLWREPRGALTVDAGGTLIAVRLQREATR